MDVVRNFLASRATFYSRAHIKNSPFYASSSSSSGVFLGVSVATVGCVSGTLEGMVPKSSSVSVPNLMLLFAVGVSEFTASPRPHPSPTASCTLFVVGVKKSTCDYASLCEVGDVKVWLVDAICEADGITSSFGISSASFAVNPCSSSSVYVLSTTYHRVISPLMTLL